MLKFFISKLKSLESELEIINLEIDDTLTKNEKSIQICLTIIDDIKTHFKTLNLKNKEEEIYFFKVIKPKFSSKLIYHLKVYNIETYKPNGSNKIKRKYYESELKKIKSFFDNNLQFYRYYRTNNTYLDDKYFLRKKRDFKLKLDEHFFEYDDSFSTTHDFKIAQILANDLLQIHLEDRLTQLTIKEISVTSEIVSPSKFKWSASKIALIELIYALHSSNAINNGSSDLKEIADLFQDTFQINLGDYYRKFLEIRMRKTGRTKFLDSLKELLIKRMNEADEN